MSNPNDSQPTYAAGWYADVNAPGTERWYDGSAWTNHVRPAQVSAEPSMLPQDALAADADITTVSGSTTPPPKRPWYKRKGIIIPVAIVGGLILIAGVSSAFSGGQARDVSGTEGNPAATTAPNEEVEEAVLLDVPDVVGMTGSDARATLSELGFQVDLNGGDATMPVTAQDLAPGTTTKAGTTIRLTLQEKPKLTLGQSNALRFAELYLANMPFSRAGLFQQLTSEYGEGYLPEDAEFAIATLEQTGSVDWNAEAIESAQAYLDMMPFSRDDLFQQLTSEYGAGFTADQANAALAAVGY